MPLSWRVSAPSLFPWQRLLRSTFGIRLPQWKDKPKACYMGPTQDFKHLSFIMIPEKEWYEMIKIRKESVPEKWFLKGWWEIKLASTWHSISSFLLGSYAILSMFFKSSNISLKFGILELGEFQKSTVTV